MRNAKFLVVDSSETVLRMVRRVLEIKFGPKLIIGVPNVQDALEIMRCDNVDLVICSWDMPQAGGHALLREMKQDSRWMHIPFIMMTKDSHRNQIIAAIQQGITNYVLKPFTPDELEDKINRSWQTVSKRRAERFNVTSENQVSFKVQDVIVQAAIANISKTGVLLRMEYLPGLKLFEPYKLFISVKKDDSGEPFLVNGITGVSLRLEAESSSYPHATLCLMALSFILDNIDRDIEDGLNDLILWLTTSRPDIIGIESQ